MATISEKILQYLDVIDRPVTPLEIAKNIKKNRNSVRVYLHRLVKEGKVKKEYRGYYSNIPTYDVGFEKAPKVQNLFVIASHYQSGQKLRILPIHGDVKEVIPFGEDGAQLSIEFGGKRGNINWRVKAPRGLDLYGLRLGLSLVNNFCSGCGYEDLHWNVRNFEFLWDHEGVRFEGVKSLTLTAFDSVLEKYYIKDKGLRREVRSSLPTELEHILALVQGGQPAFQLIQGVGVLTKKIDGLVEVQKGQNRIILGQDKTIKALSDAVIRLVDKIDKIVDSKV